MAQNTKLDDDTSDPLIRLAKVIEFPLLIPRGYNLRKISVRRRRRRGKKGVTHAADSKRIQLEIVA